MKCDCKEAGDAIVWCDLHKSHLKKEKRALIKLIMDDLGSYGFIRPGTSSTQLSYSAVMFMLERLKGSL
jgi:hypothetical protein